MNKKELIYWATTIFCQIEGMILAFSASYGYLSFWKLFVLAIIFSVANSVLREKIIEENKNDNHP